MLVSRTRIAAIVATLSLIATAIVMALTPAGAQTSGTIRGVVGIDVEGVAGLTEPWW